MKSTVDTSLLSNPYVLVGGGIALLVILFLWNKHNTSALRRRKNRSFRENYYKRKKSLSNKGENVEKE